MRFFTLLTYLLVPIALFLGFIDLFMLIMALLANPALLMVVFALACFVIYTFCSLRFLRQGLQQQRALSHSLKDWIKVNAYGTIFICVLFFLNASASFFINDTNLRVTLQEVMDQQSAMTSGQTVPMETLLRMFRGVTTAIWCWSALTLVHVTLQLRYLRSHANLFGQ